VLGARRVQLSNERLMSAVNAIKFADGDCGRSKRASVFEVID
jgi:hypothetical protein